MELDFDKEIDSLIRQEGKARTITIGEFAGLHPDADEIAAFVENAVPVNLRTELIGHFASCDNCRQTLSNVITVNAESVSTASEGVAAPVEAAAVPWYRRLFMFPNLAYVMGGLVVLFGGFIGLSVFNSLQGGSADVSQVRSVEAPAAEAPAADSVPTETSNIATMPANEANTSFAASNSASNSSMTTSAPALSNANAAANAAPAKDQNFSIDGVATQPQQPASAQPPPKNEPKPADKLDDAEDRDRKAAATVAEKEKKREEQSVMAKSAPAPSGPMKMKGPTRNDPRDSRAGEADLSQRRVEDLPARTRASDPNRKQVSGKTFEFRQGAWFDTTYRGQGTITVRRHTPDYSKLDSGLRGIAESFFGTVVTIWNGKAYRIQ